MNHNNQDQYIKGRGAQFNTDNPYNNNQYDIVHEEGVDEFEQSSPDTRVTFEYPKNILNEIDSPDVGMAYSINPYQGCEHGCVYCYARNTHQYWGYSAGLDFESKIIVKKNVVEKLEANFLKNSWQPQVITLSGNTDCYQPLEKKYRLTRGLLRVFAKYGNPVSLITKNALILRDIDIIRDLAKEQLVQVFISVTTFNEELRQKMEPRTAGTMKKLAVIERLTKAGIPVGIMVAPVIPGLNDHEIPEILKKTAQAGAITAGYTVVRLNGAIKNIFENWIQNAYPEKAGKVLNQIAELHEGRVNDSQWGRRMKGKGVFAQTIEQMFRSSRKRYMGDAGVLPLDLGKFRSKGNLNLF